MNTYFLHCRSRGWWQLFLLSVTLAFDARAQDTAPAPVEPPAVPSQPAAPVSVEPSLRRIDKPLDIEVESDSRAQSRRMRHSYRHHSDVPFGSHLVPAGENDREAVSVMGSTTVDGEAATAISICGDTTVNGRVEGEAVAVLGSVVVTGSVSGTIVAVMGDVVLGPNAVVDGNITVVGGKMIKPVTARVSGAVQQVSAFGWQDENAFRGLKAWVERCLAWGRMLGWAGNLRWTVGVALGFLLFYVLLALAFSGGIERCARILVTSPGRTVLTAIATGLLAPVLIVLLGATVVGILLIPFVVTGLIFASLFGRAAVLAVIGERFARLLGGGIFGHAAISVLLGGLLVFTIYFMPVFGIFLWALIGFLGMGAVMAALVSGQRREKPAAVGAVTRSSAVSSTPPVVAAATQPIEPMPVSAPPSAAASPHASEAPPLTSAFAASSPPLSVDPTPLPATPPPPPVASSPRVAPRIAPIESVHSASLERAGFWIRIAALTLDLILVSVVLGPTNVGELIPVTLAAYGAVMWKLKGTTIGGIICSLKVVRLDDRPVDWPTAIVRALGCFLSLAVGLLGFIWIAYDPERQAWHDKVAGTVVVKLRKGVSLV